MIAKLISESLRGRSAEKILDVGPGYGDFSRIAAEETGATEITYIDYDKDILEWQAAQCEELSIIAKSVTISLDVAGLSGIEGSFDIILCQELLEHLQNAEGVLAELANHLNTNGTMIITVPSKKSEQWLKKINPSYMKDEAYGHVRQFDENELRKIVIDSGLEIERFIPAQPHYYILHTWIYATRMKVEGSSGKIISRGMRYYIGRRLFSFSRALFKLTGIDFWGRLLPRNYFVVAVHEHDSNS